jgi:hypothetical protein
MGYWSKPSTPPFHYYFITIAPCCEKTMTTVY